MPYLRKARTLAAVFVVVAAAAGAAVAVADNTSDMPGKNMACGTPSGNGPTQCFPSIQAAVNYADATGTGGTVNVGPGTFAEHVTIPNGLTLRGHGNDTVITGVLTSPLITVGGATTPPQSPVSIMRLKLEATSASSPGYFMSIKDRNPANFDTVANVDLEEANNQTIPQRDYGILNENSSSVVDASDNTFDSMGVGVLIDVNSQTASGPLGADFINDNRFEHLATFGTRVPKGIDVSINGPAGNASEAQVFNHNDFEYNGGSAIEVDGNQMIGVVGAHDNNFKGPTYGINNTSSGGNNVEGSDNYWGCPQGPLGTNDNCSKFNGTVSYKPWLTDPAPQPEGAQN